MSDESDQILIAPSGAAASIAASSSAEKSRLLTASRESSICATVRAPIRAEVTRGSRSTQAMAILGERLAALRRDIVQPADRCEVLRCEQALFQRTATRGARVGRHAVQILFRQHALGQRRKGDAACAKLIERFEQLALDPAVGDRIAWLPSAVVSVLTAVTGVEVTPEFVRRGSLCWPAAAVNGSSAAVASAAAAKERRVDRARFIVKLLAQS
jgi:hypothetical protein